MLYLLEVMSTCASSHAGAVQGQILYSYTEKWSLPNVISLAGIYQAIPVPDVPTSMSGDWQLNSTSLSTLPVMFSARGKWENAVNATEWALSNIYSQCNSTDTLVVLQVSPVLTGLLAPCRSESKMIL